MVEAVSFFFYSLLDIMCNLKSDGCFVGWYHDKKDTKREETILKELDA